MLNAEKTLELLDIFKSGKLLLPCTVIMGDNGTGKTYLMESLANQLNEDGCSVYSSTEFDLISEGMIEDYLRTKQVFLGSEKGYVILDNFILAGLNRQARVNILKKLSNTNVVCSFSVTHSVEVLLHLHNYNLLILSEDDYSIFDGRDIRSHNNVYEILYKIIGRAEWDF